MAGHERDVSDVPGAHNPHMSLPTLLMNMYMVRALNAARVHHPPAQTDRELVLFMWLVYVVTSVTIFALVTWLTTRWPRVTQAVWRLMWCFLFVFVLFMSMI